MGELDPLVAEILLKGDDEFLTSIKRVGEEGAANFEKLAKSVEAGVGPAGALSGALHLIEAAIAGITAATILFVEQQTELTQKTILLAEAVGTTAGQLQSLEAVFAGSGVKVEQFERFMNRVAVTIAREWPEITESIKNFGTESDATNLRVATSIQRVRDAQNALADNSADRLSQMEKDGNALAEAYIKIQFAARQAAQEQIGAALAVRSAELGVASAVQALNAAKGLSVSPAEKQSLAIAQAQQALDQARKAETDARIAQQEKAAEASLKRAKAEQEYDDLARKASKNARDDAEARVRDQNAVKEAIIQRAEAEQKAEKFALTNVASIRSALDGIVSGNKAAASAINLTEVSVQNLTKGIIAQAAEHSKAVEPTAYEVVIQLNKTLSKATKEQISGAERLALVNKLAATSLSNIGAAGSEILDVLEHDTAEFNKLEAAAKALDTEDAKEKIKDFRGALASLQLVISIVSQKIALFISPALTEFLNAVKESIRDSNGILHIFGDGLVEIGRILGRVFEGLKDTFVKVAEAFHLEPLAAFKGILVGIIVLIGLMASPLIGIPIILAAIVLGVGYIADNWDKVKKVVSGLWDSATAPFTSFANYVLDKINAIRDAWETVKAAFGGDIGAGKARAVGRQAGAEGNDDGVRLAGGGEVHGPGTTTSDSVFARLSRGEFVIKAAAVQAYGAGLFQQLNSMAFPGFASGGLVPVPQRLSGGGAVPAMSMLNLSIDGKSFNNLRGPKDTIDNLASFAISRQTSAAGENPSWMK